MYLNRTGNATHPRQSDKMNHLCFPKPASGETQRIPDISPMYSSIRQYYRQYYRIFRGLFSHLRAPDDGVAFFHYSYPRFVASNNQPTVRATAFAARSNGAASALGVPEQAGKRNNQPAEVANSTSASRSTVATEQRMVGSDENIKI